MAKKRARILADARLNLTRSPGSGHVKFHRLQKGIAFTPDSPVHVPVSTGAAGTPYQVTFECDAQLKNGVTIVLPPDVVKGPTVYFVAPGRPVTVDINNTAPHQIPIPYVAYYDERTPAQRHANKKGKHGFVESNSPPAMQVGP